MKTKKQIRTNRISILFSLTAILLFPFISNAQLNLNSSGEVGVVMTPQSGIKLTVKGDGSYSLGSHIVGLFTDGAAGAAGRGIVLGYNANGTAADAGIIRVANNGILALNPLGGYVGIGTTAPGDLFEVSSVGSGTRYGSARFFLPQLASGNFNDIYVGRSASNGESGMMGYAYNSTTANSYMYFGNYGDNAKGGVGLIIKKGGYVGIGTTNPSYALDVVATNTVTVGINTNGKVNATGGYTQVSDKMFKKDINSLPNALATISSLKPKSYYFDTAKFNGVGKFNFESVKQYGFIAQDVETILPELVSHYTKSAILDTLGNVVNPEYEFRALNYDAFIPILTKGIQELSNENDSLKTKANKQDSITNAQNSKIVDLQNQLNNLASTINACCNAMNTNGLKSLSDGVSQTNVELNNSQTIVLEQNVPNPFAEQTTINYFLPDNTLKAQMLFYNAQGILIQSVDLTQKGKGALNVFAQDLTNGIYAYTLVVDGKIIETKKMVKQ